MVWCGVMVDLGGYVVWCCVVWCGVMFDLGGGVV